MVGKLPDDKKRYLETAEEIRVSFIPQCNKCKYNLNMGSCKNYSVKPEKFMRNREDCIEREEEIPLRSSHAYQEV